MPITLTDPVPIQIGPYTVDFQPILSPIFDPITQSIQDYLQTNVLAPLQTWITNNVLNPITLLTGNLINGLTQSVSTAINNIFTSGTGAAAQFFTQLSQSLINSVNQLAPDLLNALNAANGPLVLIEDVLEQFAGTTGASLARIEQYVTNTLTNYVRQIQGELAGVFASTLSAVYDGIYNTIIPDLVNLPSTLTDLSNTVNNLVGQVTGPLQQLANVAVNALSELETFVVDEFKYWVGQEGEYIINTLEAFMGQGNNGLGRIEGAIKQIENSLLQVENELDTRIDLWGSTEMSGLLTFQQTITSGFLDIWKQFNTDIADPFKADFTNLINGLGFDLANIFPAVCGIGGAANNALTGFVNDVTNWINSVCSNCSQQFDPTKDQDPFALGTRAVSAMLGIGGGLGVSLLAGELISPLKQIGLGRFAAYLWDLADFKNVGGDVLRTLNTISTLRPMTYGLNDAFRPAIPDTHSANDLLFKGQLAEDDWWLNYRRFGFHDYYRPKFVDARHTEPSDRLLIKLLDVPNVTPDWLRNKLTRRGYSPDDVEIMLDYALWNKLSTEFSAAQGAYKSAYVKGIITRDDYQTILKTIGRSSTEINWSLLTADMEYTVARITETINIYIQDFRTGKMDDTDFANAILGIGLDGTRANDIIQLEFARKKAKSATTSKTAARKLSLQDVFDAYKQGKFTSADVYNYLLTLNYTPTDATLIMEISGIPLPSATV